MCVHVIVHARCARVSLRQVSQVSHTILAFCINYYTCLGTYIA